jgi:hypothetical protein
LTEIIKYYEDSPPLLRLSNQRPALFIKLGLRLTEIIKYYEDSPPLLRLSNQRPALFIMLDLRCTEIHVVKYC